MLVKAVRVQCALVCVAAAAAVADANARLFLRDQHKMKCRKKATSHKANCFIGLAVCNGGVHTYTYTHSSIKMVREFFDVRKKCVHKE